MPHVCPWWGGYFLDNRLRRLVHKPERILARFVRAGSRAMDFGCGMGFFAIPMANMVGPGGWVVAVDRQQEMLDVLERRAAKAGVAGWLRPHRCAADAIGWFEPVDFALAFYSLHETPAPERTLQELYRIVRPDGLLLVAEPVGHVTAAGFRRMMAAAERAGWRRRSGAPPVRWSRAAVLERPPGGGT